MAQQGIQLDKEKLSCSICLDTLKDPVTIPCGHNYCRRCIKKYWDGQVQNKQYCCPQCRQAFRPRPVLVKNTMLADIVEEVKRTGLQAAPRDPGYAGPGDVACDVCTGRKRKALKSCLVCPASYCEQHLQPHYDAAPLKKHKLVDPSEKLQENICSRHDEVMKAFCRTDQQCICYYCSLDEHKGHDTVSAAVERTERQKELGARRQEIQQRIQDREKDMKALQPEVETMNLSADRAVKVSEKIFNALVSFINQRSFHVREQIRAKQKEEARRAEEFEEKLKQDIAELRRKDTELEKLLHTENHTQFLCIYPSLLRLSDSNNLTSTKIPSLQRFGDVTIALSETMEKLQGIIIEEWTTISWAVTEVDFLPSQSETKEVAGLLSLSEPKIRAEFLLYSHQITLDPNTANTELLLSEGNRKATWLRKHQLYSHHPDRFSGWSQQVLSRESLGGCCYWEVEFSRGVSVAVAYKNINRTGDGCVFGYNNMSWALECFNDTYVFRHNATLIPVYGPRSNRVGVYLDYKAGSLSFYSITKTMTLLHRVQTTFTQPLCAGLRFYGIPGSTAELCRL